MDDFIISHINGSPSEEDRKIMREGMLAYHKSKGHKRKEKDDCYTVVLKNKKQKTVGVITVSFRWGAMHIETLWIHESIRGCGWGRKLMRQVENEGIKRGCHLAYTDTYTWQAPGFYEKLGYALYGKLDNFPIGESLNYYCKKLK